MKLIPILLVATSVITFSSAASAFFIDGNGHYGLRGETRTQPGFSQKTGTYQAIEQSFRLTGEARLNDRSSVFLELRLLPDERESYLGDSAEPENCKERADGADADDCSGRHQNTGEPNYTPYEPKIKKAFMRYSTDYCIVEAGRRGRDWGMGIFLDSGDDPFETSHSVFDGFDCNINVTKNQTLGFSVGFDKLSETGTYVTSRADNPDSDQYDEYDARDRNFGSNDSSDDIDQYFFTIEFDDRKANAGASFTKHVGVYFAQINAKSRQDGGANTDLKFMDLYTAFYISDLMFQNEILFRMGKSADPSWRGLGGAGQVDGEQETNKLQSIALAGAFEWTLSRSGAALGPSEYHRGDASRHLLRLEYSYAPGDSDGYFGSTEEGVTTTDSDYTIDDENAGESVTPTSERFRDNKATAMAFHRNFKPALIFFNGRPEQDNLARDGVFNPSRVVNASLFGFSYKYESIEGGNFEAKIITGSLNEGLPEDLKTYYYYKIAEEDGESKDSGVRPPGYFGTTLGYELDLIYSYRTGRESIFGVSAAYAMPGNAWQTLEGESPSNNMLIQSSIAFLF